MSLLKNASQSIRPGFEDFESEDDERLLSAARNSRTGLLLLYREKLRRLSPDGSDEILFKQQIEPALDDAGALTFIEIEGLFALLAQTSLERKFVQKKRNFTKNCQFQVFLCRLSASVCLCYGKLPTKIFALFAKKG